MKTKEEVIKEAYGDKWELLPNEARLYALDNNGALDCSYWNLINIEFDRIGFSDRRPKSLQGIENNNGWIRIESKDDLPIDNGGSYMVCEKGIPREEYQMPRESLAKGWSCGVITHYKPIVKHKKPLY